MSEGDFNKLTLYLTRIVIALSVFAVGVELPRAYMYRNCKSLSIMLGPVYVHYAPKFVDSNKTQFLYLRMLAGWLISSAFICAIIPTLGFLHSMVIAAALSPTDPILASSVVGKGKFAQEVYLCLLMNLPLNFPINDFFMVERAGSH